MVSESDPFLLLDSIPVPNMIVRSSLSLCVCRGLEAVIADYVPASLKTACRGVLYLVTVGTMAGLLYLNYADVGICKAVSMIWAL